MYSSQPLRWPPQRRLHDRQARLRRHLPCLEDEILVWSTGSTASIALSSITPAFNHDHNTCAIAIVDNSSLIYRGLTIQPLDKIPSSSY